MPLAFENEARSFVAGKSVAIVCNAPEILERDFGSAIDAHDVVLRINRAFPTNANRRAIGTRTDVLSGGLLHPLDDIPFVPPWVFWLKHTSLGARHLGEIVRYFRQTRVFHVPKEWLLPLKEQIGKRAHSGPSCIEAMRRLGASTIRVFGLTCWGCLEPGAARHWWNYPSEYRALDNGGGPLTAQAEAAWLRQTVRQIEPLVYEVM